MKTIKIGVIGLGNIGSCHAQSIFYNKVEGMQLAAVCDIDKERLKWAADQFGGSLKIYAGHKEMVQSGEIDAVIIATPHNSHPPIAIKAFENNLHVLTEKPAGIDITSVHKMNQVAEKSGKVFGIMYNQRTNSLFQKLRELVRTGQLGEIKRMIWIVNNWYRTQMYYDSGAWRGTWNGEGGGVLVNQCPHNLDIWQWIMGMPKRIRAFCKKGNYHQIQVEDDATIYGEYENGASAVFITSTGEYPGTNRLEISGTRGKALVEHGQLKLYLLDLDEREICFHSKEEMPNEKIHSSTIVEEKSGNGHIAIIQNFANAIRFGEELIAPGKEGIYGVTISNSAYLSEWKDDWIMLPPDEKEFARFLRKMREEERTVQKQGVQETIPEEYSSRWDVIW